MEAFDYSPRMFHAMYGLCKITVAFVFAQFLNADVSIEHFLWALFFMKNYDTFDVCAHHFGVDPKTFTHHVWHAIYLLRHRLDTVRF